MLAIARWLRGRGHDVSIVCPHRSELFLACVDRGLDVFGFNNNGGTPFHRWRTASSSVLGAVSAAMRES